MGLIIALLVLAIIFAILGFGGVASGFASIAVILFWVFLAILLIGLIFRLVRGSWWY
jgi:uncharacterized membrane protein YtjA (UPF0391 family)